MISLFNTDFKASDRNVVYPRMQYIQERLADNLKSAKRYYEFRNYAVSSSHILVRLLHALNLPLDKPTLDTVYAAYNVAPSAAKALGIGSSIYSGKLFEDGPHFYGKGVSEFIFLVNSNTYDWPHWRKCQPVTVRTQPKSDLSMLQLTPDNVTDETGYAVIEIDPGMLFYMYKGWRLEQRKLPEDQRSSVRQFIWSYVLPGMLESHLDSVWLNKLYNEVLGVQSRNARAISGLALPTNKTFVKETVSKIVTVLRRSNYRYDAMLLGIPTIYSGRAVEFLQLPSQARTTHTKAYELIATAPYLELLTLIDLSTGGSASKNRKWNNEIHRSLKRANSEKWLDKIIGDTTEIKNKINAGVSSYISMTQSEQISLEATMEDLTDIEAKLIEA